MTDLPSLRETLDAHGLLAKKSFGQHFLLDLNVTRKIVRLAGPFDGRAVIEVGPGPGGLTRALLESDAGKVVLVEKDVNEQRNERRVRKAVQHDTVAPVLVERVQHVAHGHALQPRHVRVVLLRLVRAAAGRGGLLGRLVRHAAELHDGLRELRLELLLLLAELLLEEEHRAQGRLRA